MTNAEMAADAERRLRLPSVLVVVVLWSRGGHAGVLAMRPAPDLEAGLDALLELLTDLWAEEAVAAARPLSPITEASQSPERAAERRIGPVAPDPEPRGTR